MITAAFESFGPHRQTGWPAVFSNPVAVHAAHRLEEVKPVIEAAEQAALAGRWAVLLLSYEAAPAFDPAFEVHPADGFPLAWAAIFDSCGEAGRPDAGEAAPQPQAAWEAMLDRAEYDAAIAAIRTAIERGETWQVNYSFPLRTSFRGDARGWYRHLTRSQQAGFCAYLDLGRHQVLSVSPELFFERRGASLRVRPMKGTLPRGRWLEEDRQRCRDLAVSEKNRAENLMIVDLLRNDLGRIARPGSVRATRLFYVETYDTVLQMTSEIEAECAEQPKLTEILAALFPCGSVTGAPKVRTLHWIRKLEPLPRGIYTGAIGWLRPGGDCLFNVAIRTVQFDTHTGEARCGVGGGITWESTATGEYEECQAKARFLAAARPAFHLLESLLLADGEFWLLERHLERMRNSAEYFRFTWQEAALRQALAELREQHREGRWKVRLLAGREGQVTAEAQALDAEPPGRIRHVALAATPVDERDVFLYHKTTHRAVYDQRRLAGCDDTILWNRHGEITESLIATLVLVDAQGAWTPPRCSGLLAGTLRDELLARGEIRERVIRCEELRQAPSFYLVNSVRGWMKADLAAIVA